MAGFFIFLSLATLGVAWILEASKRPIIFFEFVYVGPVVFVLMGFVRSLMMGILHLFSVLVAGAIVYSKFDGAMTIRKQATFDWPPVLVAMFLVFFILHYLPVKKASAR